MRQPHRVTPAELEILRRGSEDPSIITDYFFRPYGAEKGWRFDENFLPEGQWQKKFHLAAQTDIIVIGGFGTGKTAGVAMSACVFALTLPWYKFLNIGPTAYQAKQMYDYIIQVSANTPFEQFIWEKPRRPYHKIVIKYQIGKRIYESTLEFMSADKDATGILSYEGDAINIEEAGLNDNLEEIVTSVGSRLRGSIRGRPRLGRLSMISNSWDNPYLWYYFDQAIVDPEHYLSMVVKTSDNKNITDDQIRKMTARIPESERGQFLDGMRPEGRGAYFDRQAIYKSESKLLSEIIVREHLAETTGYYVEELYGAGVVHFATPASRDDITLVIGDPGVDNAPARNSPTIMRWSVPLDFPKKPAVLSGLWWGRGDGAISPFVDKLLDWRSRYNAVITAIDSTASQKNMAEMINIQYLGKDELQSTNGVIGFDFSGSKKAGYLVILRLFLESGLFVWPDFVVGIRSQLSNYDPERDKKIAQDLVACMAMSAYALRVYFNVDVSEIISSQTPEQDEEIIVQKRIPEKNRTIRSRARLSS